MMSAMCWDLVAAAKLFAGFFAAVLFILYSYYFYFCQRSTGTAQLD